MIGAGGRLGQASCRRIGCRHGFDPPDLVAHNDLGLPEAAGAEEQRLPVLPADVFAWDDASNNKWLISGKGALIMNPPSAWAVAVRDAPKIAELCWTHPSPKGPKGRFDPGNPNFWAIWSFSANKAAAKSLLMDLSQRASVEQLVAASHGYDIPPFQSCTISAGFSMK